MRQHPLISILLLLAAIAATASTAWAEDEPTEKKAIVIGTKDAPPFSMRDAGGRWYGISIELANRVAVDLDVEIEYRELTLQGLLDGVRDGTLDAAAAALTITSEREETIDFSHPFHTSGLGIAVPARSESGWGAILGRVFSSSFLKAVFALVALLAAVGFALWLFERKRNAEQFGGKTAEGSATPSGGPRSR